MNTKTRTREKQGIHGKAKLADTVSDPLASAGRDSLLKSSIEHAVAIRSMIETAAYFRAEKRGFEPGHELDDWLAAETDIVGNSVQPTLPITLSETMTIQSGRLS